LKRIIFILVYLLLSAHINAQEFSFRHLTTADGMLSDLKLIMAEDRIGRLWIGSEEGINVFDGYQLSSYSASDNSGLINNNIENIFCDKQGTIWVSTPSGIQYKTEHANRFVTLDTGSHSIPTVLFFGETTRGDLIVITDQKVYRIDAQFKISVVKGLTSLLGKYKDPRCFEQFKEDEWLVGFGSELLLVNVQQDQFIKSLPFRDTWCASYMTDTTIMAGSFTKDSIVIINIRTGVMECINDWPASDGKRLGGFAGSINRIGEHKYAIGCRLSGVYIVDMNSKRVLHLTHNPSDPSTILTNFVRRLFVTKQGPMFVHSRALSYTQLEAPQLNSVKYLENKKGERYDGGFNSFYQDKKNNFWIGANGLLALWNRKSGLSTYYPYYDQRGTTKNIRTVRTVVGDSKNQIWVGTFGGGLGLLKNDGNFLQFKRDTSDRDHTLPSNDIFSIALDEHQRFIICCNYGFAYFDPIEQKMTTFYKDSVLKIISKKHTFYALADKDDNWWLGQNEGIFFYNKRETRLYNIPLPPEVTDKHIRSIAADLKGNVYAGGKSGLFIISQSNLKVKKWISKKDGLVSNIVSGLQVDNNGNVWISGNIGLAVYNPTMEQLHVFNSNEGLEQSNHNLCNAYMARDGEIFIASVAGFNHFYPDSIQYQKKPLQVFVISLQLNDSVISHPFFKDLKLAYNNNNLSFSYMAVDFSIASIIQYRYKLEGYDTGYVYAGKQRTARYTNLLAGTYSFIVEASADGKEWYTSEQDITCTIRKAIWTTWGFRLLLLLVPVALIYFMYRNRIARVNNEARLRSNYEIKLNELENSALRTQMNPHFIFNSLNTINSFINRNEPARANQYISKFSKLIRLILDHSRQKKINLADELEVVELYIQLERIRFDNKFEYSIHVDEMIDTDTTEIPPLILQPFVENAILHGLLPLQKIGLLNISIQRKENALYCIVEDNGIGRIQAKKNKPMEAVNRKSHGIDITQKRIELFNKEHDYTGHVHIIDLEDATGRSTGTRVEIPVAWQESF